MSRALPFRSIWGPVGLCLILVSATTALAQSVAEPPPGHISFLEGVATLERDAVAEPASVNMPLLLGDRIRTDRGRLEVMLVDGSLLQIDEATTVDLLDLGLLRVLEGRVLLVAGGAARSGYVRFRVDTPGGSIEVEQPGEYRMTLTPLSSGDSEVEVAVLRGSATLATERGSVRLSAGQRVMGRAAGHPGPVLAFNSAAWEPFQQWAEERRGARRGTTSAEYLPEPLQSYAGTLDRYGTWTTLSTYGAVWYPRVSAGWRPYFNGRWLALPRYGHTWLGADPWAWPTHHFGRWGFSSGAWFWIPAAHWAPAWVHWGVSPGFVTWCPLGFDGRPVVDLVGRPDLFRARGFFDARGVYDPWFAWTVVPRTVLDLHRPVPRHVVPGDRVNRFRNAFVLRTTAPGAPLRAGIVTRDPVRRVAIERPPLRSPLPRNRSMTRASQGVTLPAAPRASATVEVRRGFQPVRPASPRGFAVPRSIGQPAVTMRAPSVGGPPPLSPGIAISRQATTSPIYRPPASGRRGAGLSGAAGPGALGSGAAVGRFAPPSSPRTGMAVPRSSLGPAMSAPRGVGRPAGPTGGFSTPGVGRGPGGLSGVPMAPVYAVPRAR